MPLEASSASRFLVPLGAVAALAVAVGVWLVPSSAFDPKPPSDLVVRQEVPPPPKVDRQGVPERDAWLSVAQNLESLREPDPEEEEPEPPPDGTGPDAEDATTPTVAPRITVSWEYEGYVDHEGRRAALIRVLGVQRFVFPGDPVSDTTLPPGITATIGQITPDHIVVEIDGGEQIIERSTDGPPVRAPATPQRTTPRGAPRPRRS